MAFMMIFQNRIGKLLHVYDRVALTIDKGGISLRNVQNVILIAFSCSFVASLKEMSKALPQGGISTLDAHGQISEINSACSQRTTDQLMTLIEKFNGPAPDSTFKNERSLSAVLNESVRLDDRTQL